MTGFEGAIALLKGLPDRMKHAKDEACRLEAEFLALKMREGILSGAPAGKKFAPHSPLYALMGGGNQILNKSKSGGLLGAIGVAKIGGMWVAGISGASEKVGRIAGIHEFGREFDVVPTARSQAWFFARLRELGIQPVKRVGKHPSLSTIHVKIPARPFIAPIVEMYAQPADVGKRFLKNFAKILRGDLGTA